MSRSLKILLEIPGAFETLKSYMKILYEEKPFISNVIQGDAWKAVLPKFRGKFVVPIFLFQDDLETGNGMGSRAGKNKLGALYNSIPCFPPYLSSKLYNTLLTVLSYANVRKSAEVEKMYSKLIEELNDLSEKGLMITVNKNSYRIYFQLILIL